MPTTKASAAWVTWAKATTQRVYDEKKRSSWAGSSKSMAPRHEKGLPQ